MIANMAIGLVKNWLCSVAVLFMMFGACKGETTLSPPDAVNPPEVLRSHVAGEAAALLDANGHFQLPAPQAQTPEISASRATDLARSYLTTFGKLADGTWEEQRGLKIASEQLRPCGRVTYARTSYEPLVGRSLWAQKLVGNWWLVMLCDGSSAQVLIAVSAHSVDVTIDERGRLVQPPVDGNNFMTIGIRAGESVPIAPEAAVIEAATRGGARVTNVPEFVVRPRPAAPWLGAWRVSYEKPIQVTGMRSGITSSVTDLAVGYDDAWRVRLLGPHQTGAPRLGDTVEDHGFIGQPPQTVFAPFRPGVFVDYEQVQRGGK